MKKTITIGGQPYTLTAPTARDMQTLLEEAKKVLPDPVKEVLDTAALLEGEFKNQFLRDNLQRAFEAKKKRGTLTDEGVVQYLHTVEGAVKMCGLMFRKQHPHLTDDQILDLAEQAKDEYGEKFFEDLFNKATTAPMTEKEVETFTSPTSV